MSRATTWAAGAAVVLPPVLAGASPAGAASASDEAETSATFTSLEGAR